MSSGEYKIAISKEMLAQMPLVTFPGKIIVISTAQEAQQAIRELMPHRLVGFDTETKPSFRKGKMNDVALMQVATEDTAYLFRLNKIGIEPVRELIESEAVTKIGISLKDDFQMLARRGAMTPQSFIDLQNMVKQYHITDASLQKIYGIIFGQRISKSQRLSNWEAPVLTTPQQVYASIDAWTCLRIYTYLTANKFNPEASPYKQPVDDDAAPSTPNPAQD